MIYFLCLFGTDRWEAGFEKGSPICCYPLFNYCVFLLWKVFGAHNWCFRLFNLLVASMGLWAFAQIVRRLASERAALFATVMFGVSVAFMYARKGMPDVFAVSLALVGVYWGWRFLEEKRGNS